MSRIQKEGSAAQKFEHTLGAGDLRLNELADGKSRVHEARGLVDLAVPVKSAIRSLVQSHIEGSEMRTRTDLAMFSSLCSRTLISRRTRVCMPRSQFSLTRS